MTAAQIISHLKHTIKHNEQPQRALEIVTATCAEHGAKFTRRVSESIQYTRWAFTVKKDGEKEEFMFIFE